MNFWGGLVIVFLKSFLGITSKWNYNDSLKILMSFNEKYLFVFKTLLSFRKKINCFYLIGILDLFSRFRKTKCEYKSTNLKMIQLSIGVIKSINLS